MARRLSSLLVLLTLLMGTHSLAKVHAEGKPKNGFFWLMTEQYNGRVVVQCRATSNSKFQSNEKCESAPAVKPK